TRRARVTPARAARRRRPRPRRRRRTRRATAAEPRSPDSRSRGSGATVTITDPAPTAITTVDADTATGRTGTHGNDRRGARPRPRWSLPAPTRSGCIPAAIAAFAAVLYTWSLSTNVGNANSYYTAAVKSATISWKAFFFGSIDPGNFITVDKPPAAF